MATWTRISLAGCGIALLLAAGCGKRTHAPLAHTLDDAPARTESTSPLACWIELDTSTGDPFFASYAVVCTMPEPMDAFASKRLRVNGAVREAGREFEVSKVRREDRLVRIAYDLEFTFRRYTGDLVDVQYHGTLDVTTTATKQTPSEVASRFDVARVDLHLSGDGNQKPTAVTFANEGSTCQETACELIGPLALESWTGARRMNFLVPKGSTNLSIKMTQHCDGATTSLSLAAPTSVELDCAFGMRAFALGAEPPVRREGSQVAFVLTSLENVRSAFLDLVIENSDGSTATKSVPFEKGSAQAVLQWDRPLPAKVTGKLWVEDSQSIVIELPLVPFEITSGANSVSIDTSAVFGGIKATFDASAIDFSVWKMLLVNVEYIDSDGKIRKANLALDTVQSSAPVLLKGIPTGSGAKARYRITWFAADGTETQDHDVEWEVDARKPIVLENKMH